jgi:transcriptional regulator with XRE-family HTH domain
MVFHLKLAAICESRGWRPIEVAKRLPGIGKSKVYNWFSGKTLPDIGEARTLARILGTDVGFLADDDLDVPPAPDASEQRVREIADRIGWDSVYDRLLSLPPQGHQPNGNSVTTTHIPGDGEKPRNIKRA